MIKELREDPFYREYKNYDRCVLDYSILKSTNYEGLKTHKEAILFFMNHIWKDKIDSNHMKAKLINSEEFFQLPGNSKEEKQFKSNDDNKLYWFQFLNPPHGTDYTIHDFIKINNLLFPKGKKHLEIYDWNVDWSTYFNDGLEWWGARCTSIYDQKLNRFVIILASATD